jgi:hypothetical protein
MIREVDLITQLVTHYLSIEELINLKLLCIFI